MPDLRLEFIGKVLASKHPPKLFDGCGTNIPARDFVGQLVNWTNDDAHIETVVNACLPDDYAGNTREQLPDMIKRTRENFGPARALERRDARFPDTTKNGAPRATLPNAKVAIELLGVECRHDLFKRQIVVAGHALQSFVGEVTDPALLRLRELVYEEFGFDPSTETVQTAVQTLANHRQFHPVCDYLDSLVWDGTPRIDTWLATYGGAEQTAYTSAVGALLLTAAVRRVRKPGCKFDEMPVLQSAQGTEKSSALQTLAVDDNWFTDSLPLDATGKAAVEALEGFWIVEVAELKGMRTGEVERVKAFLSRQWDRARMAYARTVTSAPRQCVFVGTTNEEKFLRDKTGNRRFWPVLVKRFDLAALRRDRDQLWAEAARREASGASIRLPEELWAAAEVEQRERVVENPFLSELDHILRDEEGEPLEGKVRTVDLWTALGVRVTQRTQQHNEQFGEALRELGWHKTRLRFGGKEKEYCYVRGDEPHQLVETQAPIEGAPQRAGHPTVRRY